MTDTFAWFRNMSITIKAMSSPVLIIILLIILGVIAFIKLEVIDNDVFGITQDLAPDAGTASEIMRQIYRKRLYVKDYIKTSNPEDIKKFNQVEEKLQKILAEAHNNITNPKRVELLAAINTYNDEYTETFHNVIVSNMDQRNDKVKNVLYVQGPLIENNLSEVMDSAYRDNDPRAAYFAGLAQRHLLSSQLSTFHFLVDNDEESNQSVISQLDQTEAALKSLLSELQNPKRRELTLQAIDALALYRNAYQDVYTFIQLRNDAMANIMDKHGPIMADDSVALSDSVFVSLKEVGKSVENDIATTLKSIGLLTCIATITGLAVAYFVTQGIVGPLKRTNAMLKDIAEGEGDLTKRVPVNSSDEVGELALNFNAFVEKLQGVISQIVSATQQLATSAEELSNVTDQTKAGVVNQKSEIEQVVTAIEEMTATVQDVARNAEQAALAATEATEASERGDSQVQTTITAISTLRKGIDNSSSVIEKLQQDSNNITTVLDVIKSVAEQTNLLALNAAIEAARAGEQGRGFAVVADEVRTLARRTQESAGEIENLISVLQNGAGQAVDVMGTSRESAQTVTEEAGAAGEALALITQSVTTISDMNTQIASAAQEQSAVTDEINRNVLNIHAISEQTAAATEQTNTASLELAQLGATLRNLTSQFIV